MGSVKRFFRTSSGVNIPFIVTDRDLSKPGGLGVEHQLKHCVVCGKPRPFLDFFVRVRDGFVKKRPYQIVEGGQGEDHAKCYRHFPPVVLRLPDKSKGEQLQVRFGDLRDDRGQPIDNWDDFANCWRALIEVGTRFPDGKEIRFQPRKNRKTSRDGKPYGQAKEEN